MARTLGQESHLAVTDLSPSDYRGLIQLAGPRSWHVHFLTSGKAAIQLARRHAVDLWMVSTRLKDMEGSELVGMLRETAREARVIVVGDTYDAGDEVQACRDGAALYVCKDASGSLDCQPLLELLSSKNRHGPDDSAGANPCCPGAGRHRLGA